MSTKLSTAQETDIARLVKWRPKNIPWSQPYPIADKNQNKLTFCYGVAVKYWWFKVVNNYTENISGRLVYTYKDALGNQYSNSMVIHCLQQGEMNDGFIYEPNVQLTGLYFVDFHPCAAGSGLTAYSFTNTEQNVGGCGRLSVGTGVDHIEYKGENQEMVSSLLLKVKGWKTSTSPTANDGMPPQIVINELCKRDQYIYGALMYCWYAESYFRNKELNKSREAALKAGNLLQSARLLCDNQTSKDCKTEDLISCAELTNGVLTSLQDKGTVNPGKEAYNSNMKDLGNYMLSAAAMLSNPSKTNFANFLNSTGVIMDTGTGTSIASTLLQAAGQVDNQQLLANISPQAQYNRPVNGLEQQAEARNQAQQVFNLIDKLDEAFAPKRDEDGMTPRQKSTYLENLSTRRATDNTLKAQFGYSMIDLTTAIRDFDHKMLDRILATGFPVATAVYFSMPELIREQNLSVYDFNIRNEKFKMRPIHYAALYGNEYAIRQLLSKGANVNAVCETINVTCDNSVLGGSIPIDFAMAWNRYDAIKVLFENGSKMDRNKLKLRLKVESNLDLRDLFSAMLKK
ncbi:ankyrin repeat domain-containing protein [Pedobacter hiemivivus]|uniref:ankyrin repeat domain-containing protein n=1 Tax=Pedobacter hiemivivus TaxID=2530454 RepID=UPI0013F14A3E|nr:ankyrin repeat domain-containing protein [Pedobacter hiemivivus]